MGNLYERVNWEDKPSTKTPISAKNLNKMDKGISDLDEKLVEQETKMESLSSQVEQIASNQIPEEYLKASVDAYIDEKGAGLATDEDLVAIDTKIDEVNNQLSSEIEEQRSTNYPYPFTLDSTLIGSDNTTKFYTPQQNGIKKLLIHDNTNLFTKYWVQTFYATTSMVVLSIRGIMKNGAMPFYTEYTATRDEAEKKFTMVCADYPTISIECVVDWDNVNAGYGQSLTIERACISEGCIDRRINKNTIIVGKDLSYADFTTIQSAVDFAKDGDIIYILPGEYEESVTYTKDISLVGANKLTTVLFNTTGLYDTPPLYTCSGKIENLTIEMRRDDNTTYPESRWGYALHLDQKWNTDHSKRKIEIRNCIFKSDFSDCIGCGIEADAVIDISHCICIPNSESASGLKVHPFPVAGYSSDLYLRNNVFYSTDGESSYGILLHTGGTDGTNYNTVNVHAWNNISKSYNGIDTNCFIIDEYNSGNSLSVLNG